MDRFEIAEILHEISFLLELQDETPFRAIAYHKAAIALEKSKEFEQLLLENRLQEIQGVGKEIAKAIQILSKNEDYFYYQKLRESFPESIFELRGIPHLPTSKVKFVYQVLGLQNLHELQEFLKEESLPGFGPKTKKKLILSLEEREKKGRGFLWEKAMQIALSLQKHIGDAQTTIGGKIRRGWERVFEIELISEKKDAMTLFLSHSFISKVSEKKKNKISVVLKQGIKATLTLASEKKYGYHVLLHTGSRKHVLQLKKEAQSQGMRFLQKTFTKMNEKEIYHALHMQFIPPELREGSGEIEAAKEKRLPQLIKEKEIKGAFHCHTSASDGQNSLEEMVNEAKKLGWEYIGISDHSISSKQANGLTAERLLEQKRQITSLNERNLGITIFAGTECDILKDGSLDFSNDILKELDFVIVSIHRYFDLDEKSMTKRLIKAIENPYTTIIGHLTGRILGYRLPYLLNVSKIIDACIENGKIIELNGYPNRLDMDWRYWHEAKDKGLKCMINPDAHQLRDLKNLRFGVQAARKGWLEKKDVINTLPLCDMKNLLHNRNLSRKNSVHL